MKKLTLILISLTLLMSQGFAQKQHTSLRDKIQQRKSVSYDEFVKNVNERYQAFRDSVNSRYAAMMERVWKSQPIMEAKKPPIEKELEPVYYDKEKDGQYLEEQKRLEAEKRLAEEKKKLEQDMKLLADKIKKQEEQRRLLEQQKKVEELKKLQEEQKKQEELQRQLEEKKRQQEERERQLAEQKKKIEEEQSKPIEAVIVPMPEPKPQPEPIAPLPEEEVEPTPTNSFSFYGTTMSINWGNASEFKLKGDDEKAFAAAYRELTGSAYNQLLSGCLDIRNKYNLCDWAYYKMLERLSQAACGKGTNEAVFLQGVLFSQSGYQMRYAYDDSHQLHLLCRINGMAYNYNYYLADGKLFFILDGSKPDKLYICDAMFDKEQDMDLDNAKLPVLDKDMSDNRLVTSNFVKLEAQTSVNKNIISFFNDYPISFNKDVVMKWYKYGNIAMTQELKDQLYPQLKQKIKNAPKLMAANILLSWVQFGLVYALDEKVWGYDRPFFAEETLYYPFADCEDRAILYSQLVRDLLDLDVILVYNANPGHLYTGINFEENVPGDYIMVNGRRFTIADPTYYGANVGKTMSRMNNSTANVLLLNKQR